MKRSVLTTIAILTVFFASTVNAAGISANKANFNLVEQNLLAGLESDNEGLMVSSAYYLGEYKSDKSVLPLMKILKNSDDESIRIAAALSLIKIGDKRGVYAVKQAVKFDNSERVRRMCEKFYYNHLNTLN